MATVVPPLLASRLQEITRRHRQSPDSRRSVVLSEVYENRFVCLEGEAQQQLAAVGIHRPRHDLRSSCGHSSPPGRGTVKSMVRRQLGNMREDDST